MSTRPSIRYVSSVFNQLVVDGEKSPRCFSGIKSGEIFDWDRIMASITEAERIETSKVDDQTKNQILDESITLNIAKVVGKWPNLQQYIDFGINIGYWERKGKLGMALGSTFDKDVAPKVSILTTQLRMSQSDVANLFTSQPKLIEVSTDEMIESIEYLRKKLFTDHQIRSVVRENSSWFCHSLTDIDKTLGYLQKEMCLSSQDVRNVVTKCPRLITWSGMNTQFELNFITLHKVLGFEKGQCKTMLTSSCPQVYMERGSTNLVESFNFFHDKVGYSKETLVKFADVLCQDVTYIEPRYRYLLFLGRAQFDASKPNYISPTALSYKSDEYFCTHHAKTSLNLFLHFLKTL